MSDLYEPYQQEHVTIYGHNIWHFLICTTIGNFHIVDVEGKCMEITRKNFVEDNHAAEMYFKRIAKQMLDGKYL